MSTIKTEAMATMLRMQSYIDTHSTDYQRTLEKLSSGNKYASISDNPVEVSDSIRLTVAINTNNQVDSNIQFGKNMLSMTEGAQENIISNLQAIKDITIEASNGTYSAPDKDAFLEKIRARLLFINNAADLTNFNDINILDGSATPLLLQTGPNADSTLDISNAFVDCHTDPTALNVDLPAGVTGANWTEAQIQTYRDNLNTAIETLISTCTQIGGYINRLDTASDTITTINNNLTKKKSDITDTDVAEASADLIKFQIAEEASVSLYTQTNKINSLALSLLR